jgi:signal transduction histidine kinase
MRRSARISTVILVANDAPATESSFRLPALMRAERQWFVAAVGLTGAALALFVLTQQPLHHGVRVGVVRFLLLACAPVVLLRRWPLQVFAATAAVTAAALATEAVASFPVGIVLGLAAYAAASRLPRNRSLQAVSAAAVALGIGLLVAALTQSSPFIALGALQGFLPLMAGWFIGDSVAARRRYLAGLALQAERERAAEAERARQEVREERVRIARELHDVVAHTLAVITVQAGVGRRLMERRPEEARSALESIETIGRTAQDELHVVLGLLRDEGRERPELLPAPRLVDVKELVETVSASGTSVALRVNGGDRPLSPVVELTVYRVVQEALTNVVKHAPGARASVDLVVDGEELRIEVRDDGGEAGDPAVLLSQRAPAEPGTLRTPGHGIVGMRERVAAFGGTLEAGPTAGGGYCVTARLPIGPEQ